MVTCFLLYIKIRKMQLILVLFAMHITYVEVLCFKCNLKKVYNILN